MDKQTRARRATKVVRCLVFREWKVAIRYAVRGVIVDMVDGWRGVRLSMRGRDISKYTKERE